MRVLHVGSVPAFDEETWTLEVAGLVRNPLTLSYREVRGLPRVISVSDFHCVTGWSKFSNKWEGVTFRTVMNRTKPLEEAKYALISCEHGYSTSLLLEDLVGDDVILAYRLDDQDLPPEHGGPLRLVVPHKYAYKSAKWVRRIEFIEEHELGYWESRGYSDTADPFTNDRYGLA
jgi:DMSO/TMAO reductase YedYZ molybdopterin-dependent catalytic subunit